MLALYSFVHTWFGQVALKIRIMHRLLGNNVGLSLSKTPSEVKEAKDLAREALSVTERSFVTTSKA